MCQFSQSDNSRPCSVRYLQVGEYVITAASSGVLMTDSLAVSTTMSVGAGRQRR